MQAQGKVRGWTSQLREAMRDGVRDLTFLLCTGSETEASPPKKRKGEAAGACVRGRWYCRVHGAV